MLNRIYNFFTLSLLAFIFYIPHHLIMIKKYSQPISYIKEIQTTVIPKSQIENSLRLFNAIGYNRIVKSSGYRPIIIKDIPRDGLMYKLFKGRVAGLAWSGLTACTIYLNPDLMLTGPMDVFTTTLHEYLHCLGYSHVDNSNDLMYYSSSDASLSSIEGYAEVLYWKYIEFEIFKIQVEDRWKSIKN